jgi:Kelch motif
MDSINIFDVASLYTGEGQWYKQVASGTIPPPRVDFCAVSVASPDKSSHNIYIYGGRNPANDIIYDDMYALSMPSFIWTHTFDGDGHRYGHTCHLVGNRQLLSVGGQTSTNMTAECDWELDGVAIMDLSTTTWGSTYNPNAAPYTVTQRIVSSIGGTIQGGATVTTPVGGFSDAGLSQLFAGTKATDPVWTPSGRKSNAGAIAGGVVGGVLGLAFIGALVWYLLRRKNAPKPVIAELDHTEYAETHEADSRSVQELESRPVQPYSELSAVEKKQYSELQGDTQPVELPANDRPEKMKIDEEDRNV